MWNIKNFILFYFILVSLCPAWNKITHLCHTGHVLVIVTVADIDINPDNFHKVSNMTVHFCSWTTWIIIRTPPEYVFDKGMFNQIMSLYELTLNLAHNFFPSLNAVDWSGIFRCPVCYYSQAAICIILSVKKISNWLELQAWTWTSKPIVTWTMFCHNFCCYSQSGPAMGVLFVSASLKQLSDSGLFEKLHISKCSGYTVI